MGFKYQIRGQSDTFYFLTATVIDWVDVFVRPTYKFEIVDSLSYCQRNKGLRIYAWCLMTSHLHLIADAATGFKLSDTIRDFKRFTSERIVELIAKDPAESRRAWLLGKFAYAGRRNVKNSRYKFWQDGNHPIELNPDGKLLFQKLDYIHQNPVKEMIVSEPADYLFSSARDYEGRRGLLDVHLLR
jgi:REP element-mobilizing transposase RayT